MDDLLNIELAEEEMFGLEWGPRVHETPFYQPDDGAIDSARVFSQRSRNMGFHTGHARPPRIHDFKAEGLYLIGMYLHMSSFTGFLIK